MKACEAVSRINSAGFEDYLQNKLAVPPSRLEEEKERFIRAVNAFCELYGEDRDIRIVSVGGRSEISGNHTDHNGGRVIAASVNLSIIAVCAKRNDGTVRLKSEGFHEDTVPFEKTLEPCEKDFGKSAALIAGCERAFINRGLCVGGFDAYTVSNVLKGSGLSSSAAFEVAICKMLSVLYNGDGVEAIELAKMSKYAENVFFGKPCGLMDQAACAVGGFITVDFADENKPAVEKLDFDLTTAGYALCITDTGGNHADLTPHYASVPAEMKAVANLFGEEILCTLDRKTVFENADKVRRRLGDRHFLRAMHFFDENERVAEQVDALKKGETERFFELVKESGLSSYKYLQNVYPTGNTEQGVATALYMTECFFKGENIVGVCRVHGGGFAGTIQAFVPLQNAAEYKKYMESFFGEGACYVLGVRSVGAECVF